MADQTRCGVAGIWMLRTLSGHSASMIAFISVGVEPTVPDSPTPLRPADLSWPAKRYPTRRRCDDETAYFPAAAFAPAIAHSASWPLITPDTPMAPTILP